MSSPDTASPSLAIETRGLTKKFGAQTAVEHLDLVVPAGSVFGFLGPNGSGKTTTIRMLLGLITASSGQARVLGREMPARLDAVLPRVGALVEGPAFYPFLSGRANLIRLDSGDRHASVSTRKARVQEALERVGLEAAAGKKVKAYSLGMKQRLGLANALLQPRELMILDEPTNGLDPQGTREVRNLVQSLAAGGTTIFVSSHLLAEVEQICTHAAIMRAGSLAAQGTLSELRAAGRSRVTVLTPDAGAALAVLAHLGLVPDTEPDTGPNTRPDTGRGRNAGPGRTTHISAWRPEHKPDGATPAQRLPSEPEEIVAALVSARVRVRGFSVEDESLENRFVELTGSGFNVAP